jgi:hypothetical protein
MFASDWQCCFNVYKSNLKKFRAWDLVFFEIFLSGSLGRSVGLNSEERPEDERKATDRDVQLTVISLSPRLFNQDGFLGWFFGCLVSAMPRCQQG